MDFVWALFVWNLYMDFVCDLYIYFECSLLPSSEEDMYVSNITQEVNPEILLIVLFYVVKFLIILHYLMNYSQRLYEAPKPVH